MLGESRLRKPSLKQFGVPVGEIAVAFKSKRRLRANAGELSQSSASWLLGCSVPGRIVAQSDVGDSAKPRGHNHISFSFQRFANAVAMASNLRHSGYFGEFGFG
jgi:hypothetical protein